MSRPTRWPWRAHDRKTGPAGPRPGAPGARKDTSSFMCGIVGYVGNKPLLPVIMEGLRKLEYRGYDSAGVAVVKDGQMVIRRSAGKLSKLDDVLAKDPIDGEYGIGHTRWATHGR